MPDWAPYDVLYTDYTTMAVVHSCISFGDSTWNQQWVITRDPINIGYQPDEYNRVTNQARSVLEKNIPGFDFESLMRETHQGEDCTY